MVPTIRPRLLVAQRDAPPDARCRGRRARSVVHRLLGVGSIMVLAGCATLAAPLRAASGCSCPSSLVTSASIGAGARVSACEHAAADLGIDRSGRLGEALAAAAPRSTESLMRALAIARPALDECLPRGMTRIRFTMDRTGLVTRASALDTSSECVGECVTRAFQDVRIDEPAGYPRTMTVRISARGRMRVILLADDAHVVGAPEPTPDPG
jgi:hypothetical protein